MKGSRKTTRAGVDDPIVTFLAGAFVGIMLGPRMLSFARAVLEEKAIEFGESVRDRFRGQVPAPAEEQQAAPEPRRRAA